MLPHEGFGKTAYVHFVLPGRSDHLLEPGDLSLSMTEVCRESRERLKNLDRRAPSYLWLRPLLADRTFCVDFGSVR